MMAFSIIDAFILLILLIFGIVTAIKGFSKEIFSQAAWILGVIFAAIFYKALFPHLYSVIKISVVSIVLSFVLIFSVVFLIVKIIGVLVSKVFEGEIASGLDHTLGFFLGLLEGFIVVLVLVFIIQSQPWFSTEKLFENSLFMEAIFSKIIPSLHELLELVEDNQDIIDKSIKTGKKAAYLYETLSRGVLYV